MTKSIEMAVELLVSKIKDAPNGEEAIRLSQAALNLVSCSEVMQRLRDE